MTMWSSSENGKLSNSLPSRGVIWEQQHPQQILPHWMLTSLNDFINSLTPNNAIKRFLKMFLNALSNTYVYLVSRERHLPMGLTSKNNTGVRRMALNMLSWRFWADLTRTWKKSKLRRKPNTTGVAVRPEKSVEKKKNPSAHNNVVLVLCVPWTAMHGRGHY